MSPSCCRRSTPRSTTTVSTTFDPLYPPEVRATTPGGELSGVDPLVAQARRSHEQIPALQHLVSSILIDDDGDVAQLRANLVATFADSARTPTFELGSIWRGHAIRDTEGWRVSDFTITPVWQRGIRPAPLPEP